MDRLFHDWTTYCEEHTDPQSDLLYELERETHLKTLAPQMLTGHLQGRFLALLSRLVQPQQILEIGTFTGYGTLCLAEGLSPGGALHTIEVNPEVKHIQDKYFAKAGIQDRIIQHQGDALQIIPTLSSSFDLVLIDAGKLNNAAYFDLVIDRVNPGGLLLTDNVLWSGKVVTGETDKATQTIAAFNRKVADDPRVHSLMLPLRDGLTILQKIG
ncbi:MAG: O-methyltransferase [Bacteroidota bacterium]